MFSMCKVHRSDWEKQQAQVDLNVNMDLYAHHFYSCYDHVDWISSKTTHLTLSRRPHESKYVHVLLYRPCSYLSTALQAHGCMHFYLPVFSHACSPLLPSSRTKNVKRLWRQWLRGKRDSAWTMIRKDSFAAAGHTATSDTGSIWILHWVGELFSLTPKDPGHSIPGQCLILG